MKSLPRWFEKRLFLSDLPLPIKIFLPIFSALYGLGISFRKLLFYLRIKKVRKLPCPVICLGNITVGGTGKTSAVMMLAQTLKTQGKNIVILTRGYRGESGGKGGEVVSDGKNILLTVNQSGDEAYLLAKNLTAVPVIRGWNRYQAGKLAWEKFKPQAMILDDGFQHWSLYRDLDIVCIDTLDPFGRGYLLPWGRLREPLSGLKRADLFLLTHTDLVKKEKVENIKLTLRDWNNKAGIVSSCHQPLYFYPYLRPEEKISLPDWVGKPVIAFSSVGNPESFLMTLKKIGLVIKEQINFPDHFFFGLRDLSALTSLAREKNLPLVTTDKDAARLVGRIECFILQIQLKITEGEKDWQEKILPLFT